MYKNLDFFESDKNMDWSAKSSSILQPDWGLRKVWTILVMWGIQYSRCVKKQGKFLTAPN
jgi:hypothetical protein